VALQPQPTPMPSPGAIAGTPTICGALQQQILAPVTTCLLWVIWIFASIPCICISCIIPPLCCYSPVICYFTCVSDALCTALSFISCCTMPIKVCCGLGSDAETMLYQNVCPSEMSTWLAPCLGACGGGPIILPQVVVPG
jgi:hypothetical protein